MSDEPTVDSASNGPPSEETPLMKSLRENPSTKKGKKGKVATVKAATPKKAAAKPAKVAAKASPKAAPKATPKPSPRPMKATWASAASFRRAADLLKHVSDPTRLQIIQLLAEGEKHVGALCESLNQTQPAVSHHLALLRHGSIISPRRAGKNNFYFLAEEGEKLGRVISTVMERL